MSCRSSHSVVMWISPAGCAPVRDGAIGVDFDAVALGVGKVDCLADDVVGCPVQRHTRLADKAEPAGKIGSCRQEKGGMWEHLIACTALYCGLYMGGHTGKAIFGTGLPLGNPPVVARITGRGEPRHIATWADRSRVSRGRRLPHVSICHR
jgi:hypothetical protein